MSTKTRVWIICLAAVFWCSQARAQSTRNLTGTVVDAVTGEALGGATVRMFLVTDSDSAPPRAKTITRLDGSFTIGAPKDTAVVLEISYLGYSKETVTAETYTDVVTVRMQSGAILQPQVTVTAQRRTRSVEDACCRVESIRDEIQQHAPFSPSVSDVLRRYSSCSATRVICAVDNSSFTRLRGLEPTYVRGHIDGVPAFTGLMRLYALTMIPAGALQTIRIMEGASNVTQGDGAISGVVNFETRPPTEVSEYSVSTTLSDFSNGLPGHGILNAGYTGMTGELGIAAFVSANIDHGARDESQGSVHHTGNRVSGMVKLNAMTDSLTELNALLLAGVDSRSGELPSGAALAYTENTHATFMHSAVSMARTLGVESEVTASAAFALMNLDAQNGGLGIDAVQRVWSGGIGLNTGLSGGHVLRFGAEFSADQISGVNADAIAYSNTSAGLYAQDEYTLNPIWKLNIGGRLDYNSASGWIASPRVSLKFDPVANMEMRLAAGRGFKSRALFDEQPLTLHGVYRWRNNPDFKYETSFTVNYDISYRFAFEWGFGMDVNMNLYRTTISGKAAAQADSLAQNVLFYSNNPLSTRLQGVEMQLRPSFGEHWSGTIAAQFIDYTAQDAAGNYQRVPLAPRVNCDLSLMFRDDSPGVVCEAWGNVIGGQRLPANETGTSVSPAYTLLNLRLEKTLGPVVVFVGLTNILDARQSSTFPLAFKLPSGHYDASLIWGPLEGREVFLGARMVW